MKSLLKTNGYTMARRKGSHYIYKKGDDTISLPMSDKTICGALAAQVVKHVLTTRN